MRSPQVFVIHLQGCSELPFDAVSNAPHFLQSLTLDNQRYGAKNFLLQYLVCEKIAGTGGKQLDNRSMPCI